MTLNPETIYGSQNDIIIHSREQVLGKTPIKGLECIVPSCNSDPKDVCLECQQYICENHRFRHPNCDEGK